MGGGWGLSQPAVSMEAWLVICSVDREDVRLACTLISAKLRCTQGSELPVCSLPLVHTWQGGLGPPPPSLLSSSPSPMDPWETLSHTSGHQNSSLVFNHSPFEAVPRKIPCPPTVLRTLSFQVGSFVRAEQLAVSQELSIAFDFFS